MCPYHGTQLLEQTAATNDLNSYMKIREEQERKKIDHRKLFNDKERSRKAPVFRSLVYGTKSYNMFISHSEALRDSIDQREFQTIMEYTGWAYTLYRGYYTGVTKTGEKFGEKYPLELKAKLFNSLRINSERMDSIISKAGKLDKPVSVFRGEKIRDQSLGEFLKNYEVGSVIEIPYYPSTSFDPKIASEFTGKTQSENDKSVVYVIRTKEGAMLHGDVSEQGFREKEMILPRGRKYRVDKIAKGTIEISPTNKHRHTFVYMTMLDD